MGGRIPRRPPNGPGTFCFSMPLRRWLTGGEITISVGKSKPSLSSSLCDELLFMSVARWDWNIPNKRFPLQRMEAAAAHVEAPHHFNSSHTVPFIHWLWWYVSSLDWRNGTNSSHISRSRKQIVFHDFPGEFCIFFFCRTLEIKNFQVLLSWPLSLSPLAATPHPLYDFVIGQKGVVDYLLLLSHPSSTSQLQGRCQQQPLCNCLVITVKMGCASRTNRPSLTSWTQLECRT